MKRGQLKPLVYDALIKERTVNEVVEYVYKKYGLKISDKTVYHHIRRVSENKEIGYKLYKNGEKGTVSYGSGLSGLSHRGWQSVKTSFLFVISTIPVENFHTNCRLCDFSGRGGK